MDRQKRHLEQWLLSEQRDEDDAAELAFEQLFSVLPRVQPSAAFIGRTVSAARTARTRRRVAIVAARIAAGLVVAIAALAGLYAMLQYGGASLVTTGALIGSRALIGPVLFIAGSVQWWSILASAAATIGDAIATPANQIALISSEFVCACAVYALQRLLRMEPAE